MNVQSMVKATSDVREAGIPKSSRTWPILVLAIVRHLKADELKKLPAFEVDKKWIECIAIADAVRPISMTAWSKGKTLDYLDKHFAP